MARSRKKPSRDPGSEIKAILRREVNFGCPVRFPDGGGCGSPVLTFHHFDPPWSECFAHSVDGMIALCPEHHHQADGGLFTRAQLAEFKRSPYVDDRIKVRWPWQTESMLIKVGRSLVLGGGAAIRLDGTPVLRFDRQPIPGLGIPAAILNSTIRGKDGRPWLRIDDGWFDLRLEPTTDLTFTPQTKKFIARHSDQTYLGLSFHRPTYDEFRRRIESFWDDPTTFASVVRSIENSGGVDSEGCIPFVEMEGRFTTSKVDIAVEGDVATLESLLPWMRDRVDLKATVVDREHRMILRVANGPEFFSLG